MTLKNSKVHRVSGFLRAWLAVWSGSLALSGPVSGLAQELTPPRYLSAGGAACVSNDDLELSAPVSVVEQTESGLPRFPEIATRPERNETYLPAALRTTRTVLLPTSLQEVEMPLHGDGIVLPLDTNGTSYTSAMVGQDVNASNSVATGVWTFKPVDQLELAMHKDRLHPENSAATVQALASNGLGYPTNVGTVAAWVAPNITYQPLLFEDARLERYGYASPYFGIQPARSGVHFATSSILFPWRVWFHRNECESPLAFERPGSWAPTMKEVFVPAVSNRLNLP
ncbi:MAG: hypothetical protein JNL67_12585 [Planctomycetaceae bacterium]|nr:hypothetical protein [Planctomycetaceae bacterium]